MKIKPVTIENVDCFNCKKPQTAKVERDILSTLIKGQEIHYFGERAYCTVCEEEMFPRSIRERNHECLEMFMDGAKK